MYVILKNVFGTNLLDEIVNDSDRALTDSSKGHFWTNYGWPDDIILDSGVVLCTEVDKRHHQPLYETIEQNGVFITPEGKNLGKPKHAAVMLYNWQRYSYIPFHTDTKVSDVTCTVFLNKEWDKNWGGANVCEVSPENALDWGLPGSGPRPMEGLIQSGTTGRVEHTIEYPEYNKMLVNYSYMNIKHSTTLLAPAAPNRLTLQIFFRFEEQHLYEKKLVGRPAGGVIESHREKTGWKQYE